MSYPHWRFFLAIEQDLEATARYVEFEDVNFSTHSIEFSRILLSACAEIDAVAKLLCQDIGPDRPAANIDDYRGVICGKYPKFHSMQVLVPRFSLVTRPWKDWAGKENPGWWRSHNDVKHERHLHFRKANLDNALASVAGLFCLLLYLYHEDLFALKLEPWTRLLTVPGEPATLVTTSKYGLPDFVP